MGELPIIKWPRQKSVYQQADFPPLLCYKNDILNRRMFRKSKQCKKRLFPNAWERIAAFVPDGAKLLDVGSDHAICYLLIQQGRIERLYGRRSGRGPFQSAPEKCCRTWTDEQIKVRRGQWSGGFEQKIRLTPSLSLYGWSLDFRDFGKMAERNLRLFP